MVRFSSAVLVPFAIAASLAAAGVASAAPTVVTVSGTTTGINAGFGDRIGANSTLAISSNSTTVNWVLDPLATGAIDGNNAVVVYLDTTGGASGFADTNAFTDIGSDPSSLDQLRAATSGFNGSSRTAITFAPGFKASYAIAFQRTFGVLYQLGTTDHTFKSVVSGANFGAGNVYSFSNTFADLGLTFGDSFRYVATYLDPVGAFRSNEFQGVAASTVGGDNIGFGSQALAAGDFNTYFSVAPVPEPATLTAAGLAALGVARRRRR